MKVTGGFERPLTEKHKGKSSIAIIPVLEISISACILLTVGNHVFHSHALLLSISLGYCYLG